jgi:aspartokinase/homoserine dehydrogenase 1
LLEAAEHAVAGRLDAAEKAAETFRQRHHAAARIAVKDRTALRDVQAAFDRSATEFGELCRAVSVLRHLEPRTRDAMVCRGEQLAARLLTAAIASQQPSAFAKATADKQALRPQAASRKSQAVSRKPSAFVDALSIVRTDDAHGGAAPLIPETAAEARRALKPLLAAGVIPVVTGFIGRAPDGSITTLGRGGSDLTATLLGRVLGARRVVLWKDVPGILTADPRLVPDARLIPELHHQEAAEVAHYGAKVLHPRALIPISGTRITLHVRSFINPDQPGTEVTARHVLPGYPVKALALLPGQAVVTVAGKGMVGVHGIAARTFAAVDAARLSVSTIFQGSSESSIGFTVPEAEADRAVTSVSRAFKHEIETGLIDGVSARKGMSVIAVVGEGMAGTPGIAARVFTALETGGLKVVAIAQGSSERNISFVVVAREAPDAARRVHAAFQLSKIGGGSTRSGQRTDVVLLGFGRVGRALADQIAALDGRREVRIVGLLDRSGYIFDARGLSGARLTRLAKQKDAGTLLADMGGTRANAEAALAFMAEHAVSRPVVVDVTGEETGDVLRLAAAAGFHLVLANKKPLAGSPESYARLFDTATKAGRRVRFEATVGAGLPIIDTFHKLFETGDRVRCIEGCVSGTLMFVLSEVSAGRPFSEAVREAVTRGYAEPDPREDLSGMDAARKGLILARMMGYKGPAPTADDLVPPRLRKVPLDAFMQELPTLDAEWKARVDAEAAEGRVLRYVVSATPKTVRAKLVAVPAASPLGAATGTRNIISFTSDRYKAEPLVVSGPGAGPAVTAAGILNDICALR